MLKQLKSQRGFTLIELALVLAILAVLAGAAVPYAATQVRNQAAEKVAREMLAMADAAKSYYVANSAWPASISTLQTAGYLPSGWSATNPFGNAYTISSATTLTVASTVASDVASAVSRLVPLGTHTVVVGGVSVAGTWPRPGQSSDLSSVQGLPTNAVVFYDGTDCATVGLTEVTSARGRVIVGRPAGGTLNGTVNTALADLENRTHTHTYSDVPSHTHTVTDPGHHHHLYLAVQTSGGDESSLGFLYPGIWYIADTNGMRRSTTTEPAGISINSTGVATGTTQTTSATMPYLQLTACKKS